MYHVAQSEFDDVEKTGGEKEHTLTVSEVPSHSHAIDLYGVGANGGHVASSGGGYVGSSPQSSPAGGDEAHNNLQPFITCYMYKRTA